MKKILLYILAFVLICFLIPIIFTKRKEKEVFAEAKNENIEIMENTENTIMADYDYREYSTIKLLHHDSNEVEELPIDEYLYGVVSAEMPASFEEEALKAQAVVARTYTIYKIQNSKKHENADICSDSSCCQAWISKEDRLLKWEDKNRESYWNKIVNAVDSTKRKNSDL